MKPGVYVIITPHNGMLYVGQSEKNWTGRIRAHFGPKCHNPHLGHVLAKHGRAGTVIHGWCAANPLMQEQWLINFFGGPNSRMLYNARAGGGNQALMSEASKLKVSAARKGKPQSKRHIENRAKALREYHDRLRAWKSWCGVPWAWLWKPVKNASRHPIKSGRGNPAVRGKRKRRACFLLPQGLRTSRISCPPATQIAQGCERRLTACPSHARRVFHL